jgi:hypothetical protein
MVESIYFLKPAWRGAHCAGLRPEQDLKSVTTATAFQAVVFTFRLPVKLRNDFIAFSFES